MPHIAQTFEFSVSTPSITWRQDSSLLAPVLRFPLDETRFCPQILLLKGQYAGLTLYWKAVTGATFYVVQLSDNQSFDGPNVRAVKTTDLFLELEYINQLRVGDHFFWRVFAYNATGGASVSSEVRSVHIACPQTLGTNFSLDTSNYADIDSPQMCDNTGVDVEIGGTSWVRKSDRDRTWALNVNYDCESFEGHAVTILEVIWEIRQSSLLPVTIVEENSNYLKLDISSTREEWFEIICHVIFTLDGLGTFECKKHKKILIEGIGSGNEYVTFEIREAGCPDFAAGQSQWVYAEVIEVACSPSVELGEIIQIFDPHECVFNLPVDLLIGARGVAFLMRNDGFTNIVCAVVPYSPDACVWVGQYLLCREELYASSI